MLVGGRGLGGTNCGSKQCRKGGAADLGDPSFQEAQDCSEKGEGCQPIWGPAFSLLRGPGQGAGMSWGQLRAWRAAGVA